MGKKYTQKKGLRKKKVKKSYRKKSYRKKITRKKRGGNKWFKKLMNPEKNDKEKINKLMDDWIISIKGYEVKNQVSIEKSIRKILPRLKDAKYKYRVENLIDGSDRCIRLSEIDTLSKEENKKYASFYKKFFEELIFISIPKIYIDYKEKTKIKPMGNIDSFKFLKKSYDDIIRASDVSYIGSNKDNLKRLTEAIKFLETTYSGTPQRKAELLNNVKKRKKQLESETMDLKKKNKKKKKSETQIELEKYESDYKTNISTISKFCKEYSSNKDESAVKINSEIDKLGGCDEINTIYMCMSVIFFGKSRRRGLSTQSLNDWLIESQNTINSWFHHMNETSTKDTCTEEINLLEKIINDISVEKGISKEKVKEEMGDIEKNQEYSTLLVDKYRRDLQKIKEISGEIDEYSKNKPKKGLLDRFKRDKTESVVTETPPKEDTPEDSSSEVTSESTNLETEGEPSIDEVVQPQESPQTGEDDTRQELAQKESPKKWKVLTKSSVRQGIEKNSKKIKEYEKDVVINQIGDTVTDSEGREKIKTDDGYVSKVTSKGKAQLEEIK